MPRFKKADRDRKQPQGAAGVRPFWSGTLSFGLVSIPVDFYSAHRAGGVSSRWLSPEGVPLTRRYFCPEHDEEVSGDDLVRGYEREGGDHVVVTDEELEALDPEKSSDIALQLFVDATSIDPLYFERGYFLGFLPSAAKAYRLLAEVMQSTGKAGIATFVMRGKEHVVAIFAEGGLLSAETLRFHDEVRGTGSVELPEKPELSAASLELMSQAMKELSADEVDLDDLTDLDSARLEAMVQAKAREGQDVVELAEADVEEAEQVVDLMAVLKLSLAAKPKPEAKQTAKSKPKPKPKAGQKSHTRGSPARRTASG